MERILIVFDSLIGSFKYYFQSLLNIIIAIYFLYLYFEHFINSLYYIFFNNPSFSNRKPFSKMPKGWLLTGSPTGRSSQLLYERGDWESIS